MVVVVVCYGIDLSHKSEISLNILNILIEKNFVFAGGNKKKFFFYLIDEINNFYLNKKINFSDLQKFICIIM